MIKVVGLDIYGTVLASDDNDNEMPPRNHLDRFFDKCGERRLRICSVSDSDIDMLKMDLRLARFDIRRFDTFFRLNQERYKDFSIVLRHYNILPEELLIVGDDSEKDICAALKLGCRAIKVTRYLMREPNSYNFPEINLDI